MPTYGQTYTLEETFSSNNGYPIGTPIGIIDYDELWTFNGTNWIMQNFNNGPDGNLSTMGFINYSGLTYIYGSTATDVLYYTTDDGDNWTWIYFGGFPAGESPYDMTCVNDNGTLRWYTMSESYIYEITGLGSKTLVSSMGNMNSICTNFVDTIYVSRLSGSIRGYAIADWSGYTPLGTAGYKLDWKDNTLLSTTPTNVMQRSTSSSGSWTNVISLDPNDFIGNCTWLTDASVVGMDLAVGSNTFDEIYVYREVVAPSFTGAWWTPGSVPSGSSSTLSCAINGSIPMTVTADMSDFGLGTVSLTFNSSGNNWEYVGTGLSSTLGNHDVDITASNPGGNDTDVATLTITQPAPDADFSGTPTVIFAGEAVSFTDLSSNTPTSWAWDFGEGETSTETNPTHVYDEVGTYTVSLTATNSGGSDTETKTDYIIVSVIPPVADFVGYPLVIEVFDDVLFTDLSTDNPTSWAWDFGDGGTSNIQSPSYMYESPGNYTVTLEVSNAGGSDIEIKIDYISVNAVMPPVAGFEATPTFGNVPLTVVFNDLSLPGDWPIVTWDWDFGDGATSDVQYPTHVYDEVGTYTVSLTVSDGNLNDTETKTDYITVGPILGPSANFSGVPTSGIEPLTVSFTDESAEGSFPIIFWSWDFGDSGTSTEQNPDHEYSSSGTYTVSLTVSDGNLEDVETKTAYITVYPAMLPEAGFSANPTSGPDPLTVSFTDESTYGFPILTWDWDFGDGNTSTEQNPQHIYESPGAYDVSLSIFDGTYGDTETKNAYITVNATSPTADFTSDVTGGQAPLEVNFTNLSEAGSYPITDYFWDFGDGNTSEEENPAHTYAATGIYTVSLTVSDGTLEDTEAKVGYIDVITAVTTVSGNNVPLVFPNPFGDMLYVSNLKAAEEIEVINIHGLKCREISAAGNITEIDMSGLETGIYFVLVHNGKGVSFFKVLKE